MEPKKYTDSAKSSLVAAPELTRGAIHGNLDDLDSNLMLLSDNISYLVGELQPVLNQGLTEASKSAEPTSTPGASTALGNRIAEMNIRVGYMRNAITAASESLEV